MKNRKFINLIEEICVEEGITLRKYSHDYVLELEKDQKVRHIIGHHFDLNGEASGKCVTDKYATFLLLKGKNIPMIETDILFHPVKRKDYAENIEQKLNQYQKMVIKPNDGSAGIDVCLCKNKEEAKVVIKDLFKKYTTLNISPFYSILHEYRCFYLNGKIMLIYRKEKPYIVGDGYSNIATLLAKNNLINNQNLELNKIPKKDEKIEISWKFNLSWGAKPMVLNKGPFYDRLENLALKCGNYLNMTFATIDLIETIDHKLMVMEVNSGITCEKFLEHLPSEYPIIKEMYKKAIRLMFQ